LPPPAGGGIQRGALVRDAGDSGGGVPSGGGAGGAGGRPCPLTAALHAGWTATCPGCCGCGGWWW